MEPDTLKTFSNVLIAVGIGISALGTYGAFHFGKQVDLQRDSQQASKDAEQAASEKRLQDNVAALLASNRNLEEQFKPVEALLRQRYPGAPPDEALKRLEADLHHVSERTSALETGLEPRTLSPSVREAIVAALRTASGSRVQLYVMASDAEARLLTDAIAGCFKDAGWTVEGPILVFDLVYPAGLGLVLREDSVTPQRLAAEKALLATGLKVQGALKPNLPSDTIRVVVGPKK